MRLVVMIVAVLLPVPTAYSFEFVTPTGYGSGRAIHLSNPGPSDQLNLPVCHRVEKWWRVETGLGRLYDLSDLSQMYISGGYRLGIATMAIGYSQFGQSELYTEKLVKGSVAFSRGELSAGFSLSYLALGFGGGYSGLNAATGGLAIGWSHNRWHAAVSADDLNSPTFSASEPEHAPRYSVHGEIDVRKSQSFHGRVTMQHDERPQFGASQRIAVGQASTLLWGFSTSPFTLGGGIELGLKSGRLIYSANYHPVLGLTQMISISYGSAMKQTAVSDDIR